MALAYAVNDKVNNKNNLIKFPDVSEETKILSSFVNEVDMFIADCQNKTKSSKQLLKQYNSIIAKLKKTDNAFIAGKINKSINQSLCEMFVKAKSNLQKARNEIY